MSIETQYAKPWDAPQVLDNGGAVLNIRHRRYGATYSGDDMTNPEDVIADALDDLLSRFGGSGKILIPSLPGDGEYLFGAPAIIPMTFVDGHEVEFDCHGARLVATGGEGILKRLPADSTEANNGIGARFYIRGGLWVGDGATAGQMGIRLGASYGSVLERLYFQNFDVAAQLEFALMATIRYCRTFGCDTDNLLLRYGTWTGATASNSGSNSSTFERCRVYGKAGANSQYKVMGSSGTAVVDCIAEGENTDYNVDFDSDLATTVKDFRVSGLHSENDPVNAIIHVKTAGGIIEIERIFHQVTAPVLLDMTDSNAAPQVLISKMFYDPGSVQINDAGVGARYTFDDMPTTQDWNAVGAWVGASVPAGVLVRGRENAGTTAKRRTDFYNTYGRLTHTGDFWFDADNVHDIGQNNGARPYGVYIGSELKLGLAGSIISEIRNVQATIDFGSIASDSAETTTVTVTGVSNGGGHNWIILVHSYNLPVPSGCQLTGWVSAADTVSVRCMNQSGAAQDPTSRTYNILCIRVPA